ncbi:Lgmn [Symbiodinium natans]|uniref:Lgmn protein n=1 Tax=Symbiodinium natans TaxID=878477 RepID=A0A812S664_9DINO|nr:Lgmn [Symbiodinium natans]
MALTVLWKWPSVRVLLAACTAQLGCSLAVEGQRHVHLDSQGHLRVAPSPAPAMAASPAPAMAGGPVPAKIARKQQPLFPVSYNLDLSDLKEDEARLQYFDCGLS